MYTFAHQLNLAVPPWVGENELFIAMVVTRVFMKILGTGSKQIVEDSQKYFGFLPVSHRIDIRTARFLDRFSTSAGVSRSRTKTHE